MRKSKFWFRPCVSVFNLRMRVYSSINLSVLLEKSSFNITHSRSQIEWSGLLKCLLYYWIKVFLKLPFAVSFSVLFITIQYAVFRK